MLHNRLYKPKFMKLCVAVLEVLHTDRREKANKANFCIYSLQSFWITNGHVAVQISLSITVVFQDRCSIEKSLCIFFQDRRHQQRLSSTHMCACMRATAQHSTKWSPFFNRMGRDSGDDWGSGYRIPVRARFSASVQTDPEAHPASRKMGTGSIPQEGKG